MKNYRQNSCHIVNSLKRAAATVMWTQEINLDFLTLTVDTQRHWLPKSVCREECIRQSTRLFYLDDGKEILGLVFLPRSTGYSDAE